MGYMFRIITKKKYYFTLALLSICFSNSPSTLENQKNKPPSEFYRDFKESSLCKIEYLYDKEGSTIFSKNYSRNNKLISKTLYRKYQKIDYFIFHEECFNEDCYSEK